MYGCLVSWGDDGVKFFGREDTFGTLPIEPSQGGDIEAEKLGSVHEKCAVENGKKLLRSRILLGLTFGRGVNIIISNLHFRELRISKKNAFAHMQENTNGRL